MMPVAWHTDARSLEKHGVPREFTVVFFGYDRHLSVDYLA
jgi:hypothetical protein